MKRLILSFAILAAALFPVNTTAQMGSNALRTNQPVTVQWSRHIYNSYKLAASQRKPLVVYFYQPDCTYCQKLEREALSSQLFTAFADKAVFVALNPEKDEDDKGNVTQLCKSLEINRYPILVVLDIGIDRLVERGRIVGYYDTDSYGAKLVQIILSAPRQPAAQQ